MLTLSSRGRRYRPRHLAGTLAAAIRSGAFRWFVHRAVASAPPAPREGDAPIDGEAVYNTRHAGCVCQSVPVGKAF